MPGVRRRESVQAINGEDSNREVERRLGVWSEESAILGGMVVSFQCDMKQLLDLADRSFHIEHHAVGVLDCDAQAIGFGPIADCSIVLLRRAKSLSQLRWSKPPVIIGARWVIKLLKQFV